MGILRSETMEYYKIVMPENNAHEIVSTLGRLDLVHLIDKNIDVPANNRPYYRIIKRICDFELSHLIRSMPVD